MKVEIGDRVLTLKGGDLHGHLDDLRAASRAIRQGLPVTVEGESAYLLATSSPPFLSQTGPDQYKMHGIRFRYADQALSPATGWDEY